MKNTILFLFFMLIGLIGITQEKPETTHHLPFGVGYSFHHILDRAISPLHYKGSCISGNLAYFRVSEKLIDKIDIAFSYGNLTSDLFPDYSVSKINLMRLDIDYTYQRQIKYLNSGWNWYSGLLFNNELSFKDHSRYYNNNFNYEYLFLRF